MSETVTYKGKLKKVELIQDDLEFTCETLCLKNGIDKLSSFCDNWKEELESELYQKYIIYKNQIYEISQNKNYEYEDIFDATNNPDGSIDYLVRYYNGGCGFSEAVQYALNNLNS